MAVQVLVKMVAEGRPVEEDLRAKALFSKDSPFKTGQIRLSLVGGRVVQLILSVSRYTKSVLSFFHPFLQRASSTFASRVDGDCELNERSPSSLFRCSRTSRVAGIIVPVCHSLRLCPKI